MNRHSDRQFYITLIAIIAAAFLLVVLILSATFPGEAQSASTNAPTTRAVAPRTAVTVPDHSVRYRLAIEREAGAVFGLNASPARIAAQIHQESLFRPKAESPYAQGLAQFTPDTARWIATAFPEECGTADPWDASWSIRCAVRYDAWLLQRIDAATECDRWAMALSAYNGGLGWVQRDIKLAKAAAGTDPRRWFGHVERFSGRAAWAFKENRGYPRRILTVLEHAYVDAGWEGSPACGRAT